jgi:hypothetical protein
LALLLGGLVGVLGNPTTSSHQPALKAVEEAGEKLGVFSSSRAAATVEEFEEAFSLMTQEGVGSFLCWQR